MVVWTHGTFVSVVYLYCFAGPRNAGPALQSIRWEGEWWRRYDGGFMESEKGMVVQHMAFVELKCFIGPCITICIWAEGGVMGA